MAASLKIITVRGIPIRIHVSFLLIVAWAAWLGWNNQGDWLRGVIFMVSFVVLLFACVVLHELGHSLVAQLFGVKVHDITLWPIGGVARIAGMPEKPYQEFLITAAGPTMNVLLAIGLGLLAFVWIGPSTLGQFARAPWRLERFFTGMSVQSLVLMLAFNNLLLAVFNLIPAFPMDGGRLLRSLLAVLLPAALATRVAALIGQAIAVVMGLIALLTGQLFLGLVALFVFASAWQERQQAAAADGLLGLTVRQAMQPIGVRLYALQTLGEVVAQIAPIAQSAFLVLDAGRLVGLITRADLLAAIRSAGPAARLSQHATREWIQLHPDEPLLAAQQRMQLRPAAVVVEDGRAVGIVTLGSMRRVAEAAAVLRGKAVG
ncbi:MAG: putative zinc metalloprotease Rip3 [Chloroflexi bacterium ADurb.Bin325]|nr:MAG: putative zinc metalloprotease Rip3 [Chloroflexi bacterium ADurb.Bin325]